MNIYVSGRLRDLKVQEVINLVRDYGHDVTFDWTNHYPDVTLPRVALAEAERQGVFDADVVLVCSVVDGGVGCWLECGLALGHFIPVMLYGDCRDSLFWSLPEVHRLPTKESLIQWLENGPVAKN